MAALRRPIEITADRPAKDSAKRSNSSHAMTLEMPKSALVVNGLDRLGGLLEAGDPPSQDNCDGKRNVADSIISLSSTSRLAGQNVAPFLAKHIPEQYAPLGVSSQPSTAAQKDPNTKFCYRHRPDSKCRRTADEPTMENLQRVCSNGRMDESNLTQDRNSKRYHKQISKAYLMFGHFSLPPRQSTGTSCYRAF